MVASFAMKWKESTVMRIRNFFRHLAESFKSLRRNGWMTLSSVTAVTVTLAILGVFLVVILNTVKLADDMENNVDVSVYINYGTKEAEMKKLEQDLKDLPHVKSVTFSRSEESSGGKENEARACMG